MSSTHFAALARRAAALTLVSALAACDAAEDILSSVGEPPPSARATQLTVWTSDPSPSPITVVVNGQTLGTLTHYRTSAPVCGAQIAGAALTVELNPGSHVVSAFETQSTGTWGPSNVTLGNGQCLTYELTP